MRWRNSDSVGHWKRCIHADPAPEPLGPFSWVLNRRESKVRPDIFGMFEREEPYMLDVGTGFRQDGG